LRRASIVIGKHPHFTPLRAGEVAPEKLELEFADVDPVNRAFADMLRHGRYDVSEIAITVFFQAVEAGKPVWLLPVVAMGGLHHGSIYGNPTAGLPAPGDLAGGRVAVRAYSQTTGLWVRGLLAEEYDVAADSVTWVTTEGSHVAEYDDPPNVARAEPGASLTELLRDGRVDAAILGPGRGSTPWCAPLIPDAEQADQRWLERHGLMPINHMICVGPAIADEPDLTADLLATLQRAYEVAVDSGSEPGPAVTFDRDRIEATLSYALHLARQQGLVAADLDVPAMFAPVS
jgi:4,5-dihydroxyphthalate decarboxylase